MDYKFKVGDRVKIKKDYKVCVKEFFETHFVSDDWSEFDENMYIEERFRDKEYFIIDSIRMESAFDDYVFVCHAESKKDFKHASCNNCEFIGDVLEYCKKSKYKRYLN